MARLKNATDYDIIHFAEKEGVRQAQLIRYGLAEGGLCATIRRIHRVLREDRERRESGVRRCGDTSAAGRRCVREVGHDGTHQCAERTFWFPRAAITWGSVGWMDIANAPKDGTIVLLTSNPISPAQAFVGHFVSKVEWHAPTDLAVPVSTTWRGSWRTVPGDWRRHPTHWVPIPRSAP